MSARLVSATLGTLVLPFWPDAITRKPPTRVWTQQERPGRAPLLLATGLTLAEYQVSYVCRDVDIRVSVAAHVALLELMAASGEPVTWMAQDTDRGLYHLTDVSIAEVRNAPNGDPATVDVSATLTQAAQATSSVGPVPSAPTPAPVAQKAAATKKKAKSKKRLSGVSGTA